MPLLGQAAMLLSFGIAAEAITEHDDWHTHEHLPERLSIPGFLRGSRWIALQGEPRYVVLYEVAALATLDSDAYLQRLNNPTPWTSKMMPHYRGMRRGLCSVTGSFGFGVGHVAQLIRFKPEAGAERQMRTWLVEDLMPQLPSKLGVGSVHLLEGALSAPMTNEQRIRGGDAGVDWVIFVNGYSQDALEKLTQEMAGDLGTQSLIAHGATGIDNATYRIDYSLSHHEI